MTSPLSLYVHLPWCVRKCPYCDFNSHTAGAAADKRRYVDAVIGDLKLEAAQAAQRTVQTVFFGGGTPSFFSSGEIGRLLDAAALHLNLADDAEITMEANPGTVERDQLSAYRGAGVNRLSLGAQSFNNDSLRRLGRIHGSDEIESALRDAEQAGFDSINLDLMYALPGQNLAMAMEDLRRAIGFSPQHISWYQLTLEPNTVFHARPPPGLPDEQLTAAIEEQGYELLAAAGFRRYETSAFAKAGYRCRHNLNYWQFGDYLAAGAGAHGKLTDDGGRVRRYRKPAHPVSYMRAIETGLLDDHMQELAPPDVAFEYMLNALRLTDGFTRADFLARTGLSWNRVAAGIARAVSLGLLSPEEHEAGGGALFRPTERGNRFLNDLQALFLPATVEGATESHEGSHAAATRQPGASFYSQGERSLYFPGAKLPN
jgi:oxygen-independent coproporphyrinogen-3 oxidase